MVRAVNKTAHIPRISLAAPDEVVAARVDEALRTIGFMTIVDHGVPQGIIDAAWLAALDFFALPAAVKAASIAPGPYGYSPFGEEALAKSRGEETPPDLKESFNLGPYLRTVDELIAFGVPDGRLSWPESPGDFQTAWSSYYEAMDVLASRILQIMAIALGVSRDFFAASFESHMSALRALHYPGLNAPPPPGQLRAGVHTDYGSLTILLPGEASEGLEVGISGSEWIPVSPTPGSFVVNIGDVMERWSNSRWRSTLHRVVVPTHPQQARSARYSMAYFQNPSLDAVIEAVAVDGAPRFESIRFGEWLEKKVSAAYG